MRVNHFYYLLYLFTVIDLCRHQEGHAAGVARRCVGFYPGCHSWPWCIPPQVIILLPAQFSFHSFYPFLPSFTILVGCHLSGSLLLSSLFSSSLYFFYNYLLFFSPFSFPSSVSYSCGLPFIHIVTHPSCVRPQVTFFIVVFSFSSCSDFLPFLHFLFFFPSLWIVTYVLSAFVVILLSLSSRFPSVPSSFPSFISYSFLCSLDRHSPVLSGFVIRQVIFSITSFSSCFLFGSPFPILFLFLSSWIVTPRHAIFVLGFLHHYLLDFRRLFFFFTRVSEGNM